MKTLMDSVTPVQEKMDEQLAASCNLDKHVLTIRGDWLHALAALHTLGKSDSLSDVYEVKFPDLYWTMNSFTATGPVEYDPFVDYDAYVDGVHGEISATISDEYLGSELRFTRKDLEPYFTRWTGMRLHPLTDEEYDVAVTVSLNCRKAYADLLEELEDEAESEAEYERDCLINEGRIAGLDEVAS